MKLDDIVALWEQDSKMDETELGQESLKIPHLHYRYFKIYTQEGLTLKSLEHEHKRLYKLKFEYYMGILDEDTLKEKQWNPNPLKILKQDLPTYIDSDTDIQTVMSKIEIQKQKLSLLESIIKTITNRGFLIKNAIDWERFKSGS